MNAFMLVAYPFEGVVGDVFIRKDCALRHRALDNMRHQCRASGVRNNLRDDATVTLHHPKGNSLAAVTGAKVLTLASVFIFFPIQQKCFRPFQSRPRVLERHLHTTSNGFV